MKVIYAGEIAKILCLNEHEKKYIYEFAKREFPHLETTKIKIKKRKLPHMPKVHTIKNEMYVKLKNHGDHLSNGLKNEAIVINYLSETYKISSFQKSYRKPMNEKYCIYGIIDGIIDFDTFKSILEIKIRSNKKYGIKIWEHIQLQIYMYLSKLTTCVFCEVVNGHIDLYCVEYDKALVLWILKEVDDTFNELGE